MVILFIGHVKHRGCVVDSEFIGVGFLVAATFIHAGAGFRLAEQIVRNQVVPAVMLINAQSRGADNQQQRDQYMYKFLRHNLVKISTLQRKGD